jgi:hypothetical protein
MADSDIPGQSAQGVLIKYLGGQPHIGVDLDLLAVSSGNTTTLLTAVLKGKYSKEGKASYIFIGGIYTKYTATFVQSYSPIG